MTTVGKIVHRRVLIDFNGENSKNPNNASSMSVTHDNNAGHSLDLNIGHDLFPKQVWVEKAGVNLFPILRSSYPKLMF